MPPKADINKSTWEETEVPAVCENCLGPNPYVRMTREKFGAECKLCTRPYTVFRWQPNRAATTKSSSSSSANIGSVGNKKPRKTNICLTCARQKNCCQACMLDLTYGLPLSIRDAALRMVASGSGETNTTSNASNAIIRQYIAQNFEHENSTPEEMADTEKQRMLQESEAAQELLRKLSTAMPYNRRNNNNNQQQQQQKQQHQKQNQETNKALIQDVGKVASKLPLNGTNEPPKDPSIVSLFIMGIEDDLPEYVLRDYFGKYGTIVSIVCVHRARCAFITFQTRKGAEAAATSVPTPQGKLVLNGCKLRIAWSKPRPLGSSHAEHTKLGFIIKKAMRQRDFKERNGKWNNNNNGSGNGNGKNDGSSTTQLSLPLPPPTGQKIKYQSAQSGYEG